MLREAFGTDKPIIGMIHLGALPGSPLHDKAGGMPQATSGRFRMAGSMR
jgi:predicted TIM-barrel enzyme